MERSPTLTQLPFDTASLREHLDECPKYKLKYYGIVKKQHDPVTARESYVMKQISWAINRRDVNMSPVFNHLN